jgi:hypothetical protein
MPLADGFLEYTPVDSLDAGALSYSVDHNR